MSFGICKSYYRIMHSTISDGNLLRNTHPLQFYLRNCKCDSCIAEI
ncbi:unnamed protein product [Onchocerca flexuosa]|uniref:Yippee domain-containing protein n=1 Tax=Onchocerca flexuosa TaxID=387005 RepID=A0A183HS95_9BILA|nr:unnamed protein product [Onchocerca flexuosa]